tara:strand:+ start:479 stop:3664 length:3186 start_codon:yes stop_codon:yes gene_type:complete
MVKSAQKKTSLLCLTVAMSMAIAACGPPTINGNFYDDSGGSSGPRFGNSDLKLADAKWGRLVDVFDANGLLYDVDIVIRENITADGEDYDFFINPISQKEILTILHVPNSGTGDFENALDAATSNLPTLKELGTESQGPFVKVPRNAAIRLEFTEHVAPETVNRQTVRVLAGSSIEGFDNLEVKYVVKDEFDLTGNPVGVIIIDPTISEIDSSNSASGLTVNGIGLPESTDTETPNLKIYIPSVVNVFANQTMVLRNKSLTQDFSLSLNESGDTIIEPHEFIGIDPVSIRVIRSGNSADDYNGFLKDVVLPKLISEQRVTVSSVVELGATQRILTYSNNALGCQGILPKAGDVFDLSVDGQLQNAFVQITAIVDSSDPTAYIARGTLISGDLPATSSNLGAVLTTAYSSQDSDYQLCFLSFTPEPAVLPATGVDPAATISVMFSEAMDSKTVRSLDSMVLATSNMVAVNPLDPIEPDAEWVPGEETVADYLDRLPGFGVGGGSGRIMFGPVQSSGDARTYTLAPLAGITDAFGEGVDAQISLAIRAGTTGVLDLAGNPVGFSGFVAGHSGQSAVTDKLTVGGVAANIKYFALRGNGVDEDNDQSPEYGGQLGQYNGDGVLRGRAVNRFSRQADKTNTYVGQRISFTAGIMTPLVPAGAVLHTLYGYHHLGFGLSNNQEYNLDVEGMSWSPFQGIVYDTTFDRYSIALAHSGRLPDDWIDPASGYPAYNNSGLKRLSSNLFDQNIYGFGEDPVAHAELDETIVFDVPQYSISQANVYLANGGVAMYPWPDFSQTFTYRDTSLPLPDGNTLAGGNNASGTSVDNRGWGCPPRVVNEDRTYEKSLIPTIGLPLLMRYRCYVVGAEFGFNGSQVQIMVGSSALPAFRVFSWGGLTGSNWDFVVPDADGAGSGPTPRGSIKAYGPELHWGQVDFVTKVSNVYTHWFNAGGALDWFSNLTLEPTPQQSNPGTSVEVEFRTSPAINVVNCIDETTPLEDASNAFDAYGEYDDDIGCATVTAGSDWVSDPASLVSLQYPYFQLRFTFIANTQLNLEAEMDAFGFAYTTN